MPPELSFENLEFRVYRGPVLTARGTAERVLFRRDNSDVAGDSGHVLFPPRGGHPEARVSATRVDGNLSEHRFVATGGVRAEQADQIGITEVARYAREDGLIRGDRPIQVRGGSFTLSGPGFTLDPHDQVLRVEGGARVLAGGGGR